jgi:hypothetical protein
MTRRRFSFNQKLAGITETPIVQIIPTGGNFSQITYKYKLTSAANHKEQNPKSNSLMLARNMIWSGLRVDFKTFQI